VHGERPSLTLVDIGYNLLHHLLKLAVEFTLEVFVLTIDFLLRGLQAFNIEVVTAVNERLNSAYDIALLVVAFHLHAHVAAVEYKVEDAGNNHQEGKGYQGTRCPPPWLVNVNNPYVGLTNELTRHYRCHDLYMIGARLQAYERQVKQALAINKPTIAKVRILGPQFANFLDTHAIVGL
jgi:hypothetical protein